MKNIEYAISVKEIRRRTVAFTALLISLCVSSLLWVFIVFPHFVSTPVFFIVSIIVLFLCIGARALTLRFFGKFRQTKVFLSESYLQRRTIRSLEQFTLDTVVGLSVKRTTRGDIREIGITFKDKKVQYFDGLDDFEGFYKRLVSYTGLKSVETSEVLDYDNALFYPILGIIVSSVTFLIIRYLQNLDGIQLRMIFPIVTIYLLGLSGYFFLKRPLAVRYGYKTKLADFQFGFSMLVAALVVGALMFL